MEKEQTQKTTTEGKKVGIPRSYLLVVGIVIVALVAGFLAYQNYDFSPRTESGVAALVNGEVITVDELNKAYDSFSTQYPGITKDEVLEQLVRTKVIYDEASEEGFVVSEEETRKKVDEMIAASGKTWDDLKADLEARGMTEEEFIQKYGEQLTYEKFINEKVLKNVQVSEEEVENYYNQNPDKFEKPESVVVRHILIGDENKSPEENHAEAERVLKEVNKNNFCDKVKEYTTDTASAETCGEYAFSRSDPLVPEFIELSFAQQKGEMGIADTVFGSHIIWTVDKLPARTVSLDEARPQIEDFLKQEKAKTDYEGFYQNLAAEQDIELKFEEA